MKNRLFDLAQLFGFVEKAPFLLLKCDERSHIAVVVVAAAVDTSLLFLSSKSAGSWKFRDPWITYQQLQLTKNVY